MYVIEWLFWLWVWSVFTIAPWFFMLARLKNMGYSSKWRDIRRVFPDFGWLAGTSLLAFALVGVVADVLFNAITGSVIFRELPKEGLFTQRVKRWSERAEHALKEDGRATGLAPIKEEGTYVDYDSVLTRRERMGLTWKIRLNRIMPGHV